MNASVRLTRRLTARFRLPCVVGVRTFATEAGATRIAVAFTGRARRQLASHERFHVTLAVRALDAAGNGSGAATRIVLTR